MPRRRRALHELPLWKCAYGERCLVCLGRIKWGQHYRDGGHGRRCHYAWQDGRCPNCGEPGDPPLYSAPGPVVDGVETDGVLHCGCYYEAEPGEVLYHEVADG